MQSALDLDGVLNQLTAALTALRPELRCRVRLLDRQAGGYRLIGGDASAAELAPVLPFGEGLTHVVAETRRPLLVEDVQADLRTVGREWYTQHGLAIYYGVPIEVGDELLGVLSTSFPAGQAPTDDECRIIELLAGHAAVAIRNARLLARSESRRRVAETLLVSSSLDTDEVLRAVTRAAADLMDAPLVTISLADDATRTLERRAFSDDALGEDHPGLRRRFGEAAIGWVAIHRRSLNIPDVLADDRVLAREWCRRHGFTSALVVPILFQESLLGVLVLFGRRPFAMDAADQDLLDSFLAQAALAIHNAIVHEELRIAHQNLELSQAQLVHIEKLSALGQLVAGVAHELNNPLSAVLGNVYLAEPKADPLVQAHLTGIREGAERAAEIVRNLLQFARRLTSNREDIDVGQLVDRVLTLVAGAGAAQKIAIVRDLAPGLPPTVGDPGQVQQVLLNLVTNAFQAMEESGGTLTVRSRLSAGRLRIEVDDTGPGVPPEIRPRIFDPFFTTKPVGKGTGLGLSVAHGIVAAHEGRIWVEERPAGGARFVIELPAQAATPTLPPGARILVVDDEAHVAQVLGDLLADLGADVEMAHSASEARARLARERFDLITLDVIMPGENGVELWHRLRADDPSAAARVVFVTGNVDPSIQAAVDSTGRPVLVKPYTFKALRTLVANTLGGGLRAPSGAPGSPEAGPPEASG